jgi:hypothetical protein
MAGTTKLCELESDLSLVDEKELKEKNKHLWKRIGGKQHYFECKFEIKVTIGPADIMFELCMLPTYSRAKLNRITD